MDVFFSSRLLILIFICLNQDIIYTQVKKKILPYNSTKVLFLNIVYNIRFFDLGLNHNRDKIFFRLEKNFLGIFLPFTNLPNYEYQKNFGCKIIFF